MKANISGIYKIEDIKTGNIYIGSAGMANGIAKRWSNHLSKLKSNVHIYVEFQTAFNEDPNRLKWEILEECNFTIETEKEMLEKREQFWINYCGKVDGWKVINKRKKVIRGRKVKNTSNMQAAQKGDGNGNATKFNENIIRVMKQEMLDGVSNEVLAEKYNTTVGYIRAIGYGYKWKHVKLDNYNKEKNN